KTAKKDEDLNKVAENAAAQIKEKKYMAEFEARGVNDVWCYGIGFCCKKIKIIRA
ncbi:MAG: PD-(D/E)XK nuclease domain-containing protein, partial [Selenomonadaceae bacterium]